MLEERRRERRPAAVIVGAAGTRARLEGPNATRSQASRSQAAVTRPIRPARSGPLERHNVAVTGSGGISW